jgi:hypothetical protein
VRLAGIRSGDVVECDVRGERFYALVAERAGASELGVNQLYGSGRYRLVRARQVIAHWRRARARGRESSGGVTVDACASVCRREHDGNGINKRPGPS